jgi:hypothetical protein
VFTALFLLLATQLIYAEDDLFFGIQVLKPKEAVNAFSDVKQTEEGVTYNYKKEMADPSVSAFGKVKKDGIVFSFSNNSKLPIKMNIFLDQYGLMTTDGSFLN